MHSRLEIIVDLAKGYGDEGILKVTERIFVGSSFCEIYVVQALSAYAAAKMGMELYKKSNQILCRV